MVPRPHHLALLLLVLVIGVMSINHPDPDSSSPKMIGTALAFLVPLFGGFFLARMSHNDIATYIWISGLVIFSITCVLGARPSHGQWPLRKLRALLKSCGARSSRSIMAAA